MRIGIDFDNTIVCYDGLFHRIAVEKGWLDSSTPAGKQAVRDALRKQGQEEDWIWLQGEVYGARILQATPFPGVLDFLKTIADRRWPVNIISHKTKHPFKGEKHDLHDAARRWLSSQGIGEGGLVENIWLELTKEAKLQRIGQCGCRIFIDDLPEFLAEPTFPANTRPLLFSPPLPSILSSSPLSACLNDGVDGQSLYPRITDWTHALSLIDSLVHDAPAEVAR